MKDFQGLERSGVETGKNLVRTLAVHLNQTHDGVMKISSKFRRNVEYLGKTEYEAVVEEGMIKNRKRQNAFFIDRLAFAILA